MFEKELIDEINDNFPELLPETWQNIKVFFGEVPENTKAPYIVMYPLNNDGTRQVLCDDDDYTDGRTSIQFSVYDVDYSNACYIGRQLDIYLSQLYYLASYKIILNNTEVIRGFNSVNNGLTLETVTRLFTYTYSGGYKLAAQEGLLTVNIDDILTVNKI